MQWGEDLGLQLVLGCCLVQEGCHLHREEVGVSWADRCPLAG